jgi:hypothetical protein
MIYNYFLYKYILGDKIYFETYDKTFIIFSLLNPIKQNIHIGKTKIIKINNFKYNDLKIKLMMEKTKIIHRTSVIAEEYSIIPNILLVLL